MARAVRSRSASTALLLSPVQFVRRLRVRAPKVLAMPFLCRVPNPLVLEAVIRRGRTVSA
ncbi:hypothetical protein [Nonomuraea basaltis]|uniref:hypothetical protein n=1 Tax=Nonomuraea basaltis TaxID=2495887 RepID=UPI00110C6AE5|nr:hypothetical protein [Nonomuraea basaltis]TMR94999.1 hypothetical protein EJK15_30765 [Nonomuraea basaltis]